MSNETLPGGTTTWSIDPSHTLVQFSARHMMITSVKGRFGTLTGEITVDGDAPGNSSATAEIDVASLDTGVQQRDDHLRSADFLDVEQHPTLTFRTTRIEGSPTRPGDAFRVVGELTIRGTTREITLDAIYEGSGKDPWGGLRSSFTASTTVDRREFGLTWNQALETGGILVGNDVRITLDVQAVKK